MSRLTGKFDVGGIPILLTGMTDNGLSDLGFTVSWRFPALMRGNGWRSFRPWYGVRVGWGYNLPQTVPRGTSNQYHASVRVDPCVDPSAKPNLPSHYPAIRSYGRRLLQSITFQIQVLHAAHFHLIGFGLILISTKVEGAMENHSV